MASLVAFRQIIMSVSKSLCALEKTDKGFLKNVGLRYFNQTKAFSCIFIGNTLGE